MVLSSSTLEGPWTFASPDLPEEFKRIPLEHADRFVVLASVPGSDQAAEAVLLAQVPQVARVKKSEVKAPEVVYQGDRRSSPSKKRRFERAGQHRQGRHQIRRPLLHVLSGCVVHVAKRDGPMGGREHDTAGGLSNTGELLPRTTSPM